MFNTRMVHPAQSFATVQFATILKDSAKQKQTKNKQQQTKIDKLKKKKGNRNVPM